MRFFVLPFRQPSHQPAQLAHSFLLTVPLGEKRRHGTRRTHQEGRHILYAMRVPYPSSTIGCKPIRPSRLLKNPEIV